MTIREKLNSNPTLATVGAVLLLVACLGLIVYQFTGGGRTADPAYFLDTASGEVFVASASMQPIPPPDTAEGAEATGYRARVYACGACGDYAGMTLKEVEDAGGKVEYLMRLPPPEEAGPAGGATMMSEPTQINWVSGTSSIGQRVTSPELQCENMRKLTTCTP